MEKSLMSSASASIQEVNRRSAPPQYEYYVGGMLEKPIVVPQQTSLFMIKTFSPFACAYSPALASLPDPISHDQFIGFIDGLNSAFISSPIFQVAHIVGGTLLGTPIFPAQVVGGVLQVASVGMSVGVSMVRVRSYLKKANTNMFAPRNLIARIMTTKKMMAEIHFNNVDAKGKLLLPPLEELSDLTPETAVVVRDPGVAAPAPTIEDPRVRRTRALMGYIAPLEFEEAAIPKGKYEKYGGAPLRWLNKRQDTKLAKAATKSSEKRLSKAPEVEAEMEKSEQAIQEIVHKMIEAHHQYETELAATPGDRNRIEARSEQEIAILGRAKEVEVDRRNKALALIYKNGDKKLNKLARNEEKIANRILWIVISKINGNGGDEQMEVGSIESSERPMSN
ncbi:hypothetical protein ONS95_014266 [Cadophora gregata]|uniref:uncharacterized protein n=1 Tax=Cadophora gregata TaxID=51156 RepID=UPI0026DBC308|nr:uncharacterized protein ONS95_014266 [Cadophora gregata]KAK0114785.1 hypothetical protein ONS95_014266 [Cadophora gregata]